VTLESPGRFTRITAVLINADARTTARSPNDRFINGDWPWFADDVPMNAGISTDFTAPVISHRSPSAGRSGVSRHAPVKVTFSERLLHLRSGTASLFGPGGNKVRSLVQIRGARKLSIRPRKALRAHTRYTVRLGGSIMDSGGNRLSAASRTWTFRTAR
jgi:hypothetical protein